MIYIEIDLNISVIKMVLTIYGSFDEVRTTQLSVYYYTKVYSDST